MSKPTNSRNKKVSYSLLSYQTDIRNGLEVILDSVRIVNNNANIIRKVLHEVQNIKTITDVQREDYINALNILIQHTVKTIGELEEITKVAMDNKPEYFKGNNLKVSEWAFTIHTSVMDACAWIPELTPIYQGIITELDNSKNFELVQLEPITEQTPTD